MATIKQSILINPYAVNMTYTRLVFRFLSTNVTFHKSSHKISNWTHFRLLFRKCRFLESWISWKVCVMQIISHISAHFWHSITDMIVHSIHFLEFYTMTDCKIYGDSDKLPQKINKNSLKYFAPNKVMSVSINWTLNYLCFP